LISQKLIDNLDQEINILRQIKHPHIVNLLDAFKIKDEAILVMEYCKGGDLAKYMKVKKKLSEETTRHFLFQIADALHFMTEKKLIHRDLKPSNILLVKNDDEKSIIKIADFGYARYIETQDLAETTCGTPLYMAPEVLQSQKYDSKADLWSVGCIMYEMLTGRVPFAAQTHYQLFEKIKSQEVAIPIDLNISDECRDLLLRLLKKTPTDRISFEEFFHHPFLQRSSPSTEVNSDDGQEKTDVPSTQEENDIHHRIQEALNSLLISHEESSDSTQDDRGIGTLKTDDEYVVINSAAVEVNAVADILKGDKNVYSKAEASGLGFQSSLPYHTSPSTSPTIGSALARALASTAKLVWASPTNTEEQNARDILSSINSLSLSASTDDERSLWKNVTTSARRANVVAELAVLKLSSDANEPQDDIYFNGYVLYMKALSIIRVAIDQVRRFWQAKGQVLDPKINQVVQYLRDRFNDYLQKAEDLQTKLKETKYGPQTLGSKKVNAHQARLMFERGKELGKEAGLEEVVGNFAIAERFYIDALVLFEALLSRDPNDPMNDNDRKIIENYASMTLKRLRQVQKKSPAGFLDTGFTQQKS